MRRKAGFGQRRQGKLDRGGFKGRSKPRRANSDFIHYEALGGGKRLGDTPDAGPAMHSINTQREFRHGVLLFVLDDTPGNKMRVMNRVSRETDERLIVKRAGAETWGKMQREFPEMPLVGVGAVVVDQGRVLLVRRGTEPMKGHWSLPGGLVELGETLAAAVVREVREETGLTVEPLELIELLDRIHREGERVRYHYVIADYLCRVAGGQLRAASDAEAVRWVERPEWNSHSALILEPITVRVIEAGWQSAQALGAL